MALADFTPDKVTVPLGKTASVDVRGLGIQDFSQLMHVHLDDLGGLIELYEKSGGNFTEAGLLQFVLRLVTDAPGLVAHAIALAADEPTLVDKASSLPIPVQLKLVQTIGALTFEDFGGAKKTMAMFENLLASAAMMSRPAAANA